MEPNPTWLLLLEYAVTHFALSSDHYCNWCGADSASSHLTVLGALEHLPVAQRRIHRGNPVPRGRLQTADNQRIRNLPRSPWLTLLSKVSSGGGSDAQIFEIFGLWSHRGRALNRCLQGLQRLLDGLKLRQFGLAGTLQRFDCGRSNQCPLNPRIWCDRHCVCQVYYLIWRVTRGRSVHFNGRAGPFVKARAPDSGQTSVLAGCKVGGDWLRIRMGDSSMAPAAGGEPR